MLHIKREESIGRHCSSWGAKICNTQDCGIACLNRGISETYFQQAGSNFRVDVNKLYDANGELVGHIEVVQDITSLEEVMHRQQELIEHAEDACRKLVEYAAESAERAYKLSDGANEQTAAVEELVATVGEIASHTKMNAESLQVVSVEIGEDEVVFKATGFIYTYASTYSKIGEVTPFDLEIPEDLDYLRISDAWSIADIKGIFGLSALSDENASAILDQVPIDLFHGNPGIYTFSDNTGASFPAIGYEFVAETQDEAFMWVNGEFVSFVDTMLADDGYTMDYDTFAYYKEFTIGEDVYRIDVTYSIALSEKENTYIAAYIPNIALVK